MFLDSLEVPLCRRGAARAPFFPRAASFKAWAIFALGLAWASVLRSASAQTTINAGTVLVTVDDTAATQDLDDFYLGINIDTGSIYNGMNFTDPLLIQLASNLAPAQVRGERVATSGSLQLSANVCLHSFQIFSSHCAHASPVSQVRVGGGAADALWYVPGATSPVGPTPDPLAPKGGLRCAKMHCESAA